jgi:hypothetical protein
MAQTATTEQILNQRSQQPKDAERESRERLARESAERYRRSVNEVNRTRDSDIEKALRS